MNRYDWAVLVAALCILTCAIALLVAGVTHDVIPNIDKTAPLYHWWQALGG